MIVLLTQITFIVSLNTEELLQLEGIAHIISSSIIKQSQYGTSFAFENTLILITF
jgi:hypothetical protein